MLHLLRTELATLTNRICATQNANGNIKMYGICSVNVDPRAATKHIIVLSQPGSSLRLIRVRFKCHKNIVRVAYCPNIMFCLDMFRRLAAETR